MRRFVVRCSLVVSISLIGCREAPRPKAKVADEGPVAGVEAVQSFPVKQESDLVIGMHQRPRLFTLDAGLEQEAVARVRYTRERWRPLLSQRAFMFEHQGVGDVYFVYKLAPNPSTGEQQPYEKCTVDVFLYADGSADVKITPEVLPSMETVDSSSGAIVSRSERTHGDRMYRVYADGSAASRSMQLEVEPTSRCDLPQLQVDPWFPARLVDTCVKFCAGSPGDCRLAGDPRMPDELSVERPHPTDRELIFEERLLVGGWRDVASFDTPEGLYHEVKNNFAVPDMTYQDVFTLVEVELAPEMR